MDDDASKARLANAIGLQREASSRRGPSQPLAGFTNGDWSSVTPSVNDIASLEVASVSLSPSKVKSCSSRSSTPPIYI
jgi:hypothetical protein